MELNPEEYENVIVYGIGQYYEQIKKDLFPRATSQADMLACPFGDCREGQIPRSSAAQQV